MLCYSKFMLHGIEYILVTPIYLFGGILVLWRVYRGWRTFPFLPSEPQGSNSGYQSWQQKLLPCESSHHLKSRFLGNIGKLNVK